MAVTGPTIGIETIDARHGQTVLLELFGTKIILRLGVDPVRLPQGSTTRAITVDRIGPTSAGSRWTETREVDWSRLPEHLDRCEQVRFVLNDEAITEQAAIGVMLLLIHELEGAVLARVLPIGSGGDYLVSLKGATEPVQVEVCGIRSGSANRASSRLGEKRGQVRGAGFVSVTTFQHGDKDDAHSYLHFTARGGNTKDGRK